jgi:hypothetical protein
LNPQSWHLFCSPSSICAFSYRCAPTPTHDLLSSNVIIHCKIYIFLVTFT